MRGREAGARRSGGRLALALLLCALPAAAAAAQAPPGPPPAPPGSSLTEALSALARAGLPVVFSSRHVRPEMTVVVEPRSSEPRARLDELLAPHGLVALPAAGGSLVVTSRDAPEAVATLGGTVRSRHARQPVAGVRIRRVEGGVEVATDADGRFELAGLPAGRHELELRHPGYVVESVVVELPPGERVELGVELQPAPFAGEEIVVHPSRASALAVEPVGVVALDREQIAALPQLGGDVLRALELLPGIASNDLTAQFHVRGGRRDEVLLSLDGQELYEGFHLPDYDSALGLVAASSLGGLALTTGAFPVSHGDRMGGVLELTTLAPEAERRYALGASLLTLEASAAGSARGGRAGWLVVGRHGTARLAEELVDRDRPEYSDLLARVDHDLGEHQSLRLHLLAGRDRLDLQEGGDEPKSFDTAYDSGYLWLAHQLVAGPRAFADTALSATRLERDRRAVEADDEKAIAVEDRRRSRILELRQAWHLQAGDHLLQAGAGVRRFRTDYDYFSLRRFETPLALLRAGPAEGEWSFRGRLEESPWGLFLGDRWPATEELTLEAGLRFDEHPLAGARIWSPRLHAAWRYGGGTTRAGWGRYAQSQRTYELAVIDGESELHPLERSEHLVLGHERELARGPVAAARLELYRRSVEDPRPRYESLLEPFDAFPEGEVDRYRFAPTSSLARGAELYLRGRPLRRLEWWLAWAWAESEDTIAGARVPRLVDQRQTVSLDLSARLPRDWRLDLVGLFHTGRPTTAVSVAPAGVDADDEDDGDEGGDGDGGDDDGEGDDDGGFVPVLGPLNGERLGDYLRIDLRLSRTRRLARGELTFYLDVQNLAGRENPAGYSIELDGESGELVRDPELWPGRLASAGVRWEL